jgi:uncharacterized membrane protein
LTAIRGGLLLLRHRGIRRHRLAGSEAKAVAMGKGRLEAFTDGVVAIIITIMVLEVKVPHGADLAAVLEGAPVFSTYVLSFVNVGIFWNNHHHMLHATGQINGRVLWANLLLLFWLSLVPFVIRWIDEAGLMALPVAAYGVVLFMAGGAYSLLQHAIVARNGRTSALAAALGSDRKGKLSLALYGASVPLAFFHPGISIALYVAVALMWFVPDRRIESTVK